MVPVKGVPFEVTELEGKNPLMLEIPKDSPFPVIVTTTSGCFRDVVPFKKGDVSVFRTAFSKGRPEELFCAFVKHCHDSDRFIVAKPPEDKEGRELYRFELPGYSVFTEALHIGNIWVVGDHVAAAVSPNLCIMPHELARRAS